MQNIKIDIKKKMNITIFNVGYSDNYGDGVISDNVIQTLRGAYPNANIYINDLSGRTSYPVEPVVSRTKIISYFPAFFRPFIVAGYIVISFHRRWKSVWRESINNSDLVVIGGGQLFYDSYLNFPVKLLLLSILTKRYKKNVCIFSVGVSREFSLLGKKLLMRSIHNFSPAEIFVRDAESKENIINLMSGRKIKVDVIPDPAVLSSETYGERRRSGDKKIGVGIASEAILNQSSPRHVEHAELEEFYVALVLEIIKRGWVVELYTNGAFEDEDCKQRIWKRLAKMDLRDNVNAAPRVDGPKELVGLISTFSAIVAHRLHSNIIAFSLGIPSVGLMWDRKVIGFYNTVGLDGCVFPGDSSYVGDIVDKLINENEGSVKDVEAKIKIIKNDYLNKVKMSKCFCYKQV